MKTVAFYTLGCKVNQYETQAMRELFEEAGYKTVAFEESADVYVINTCSVTSLSDRKSRQMIGRARRQNPNAVIAAAGCYAQTAAEEVGAIEGVNVVLGTQKRKDIVELAERAAIEKINAVSDIMHTHEFENLEVHTYSEKTRAYIKVQEGCSQFCSYCIIPYARGPIRSRAYKEVIEEARRLAGAGYKELVLVGIHIASYGRESGGFSSLEKLISGINGINGVERIRLSSIEPMTLDEKFIGALSGADKLCPHFHISLQSGCDETLKRMNRKYTANDFARIAKGLRSAFDGASITTDVMVGFPGETEEEFEESLSFVKKIGFADLHVFPYSPRRGTPAAKMKGQVAPTIKKVRSERMIEAGRQSRDKFLRGFAGSVMPVLFERERTQKIGIYEGKTENYITAVCKSDKDLSGKICSVLLEEEKDGIMYGKLV